MESLLLRETGATLEFIRKTLYGIQKPTIIDEIELVPNGLYATDPSRCLISRSITGGEYGDSIMIRNNGEEYPFFYSANSSGANPGCVSYGKKDGEGLILLQEIFSPQSLYKEYPELTRMLFFRINESLIYGQTLCKPIKGELIFDSNTKKCSGYKEIRKVIGAQDMMAMDECLSCCQRVFRLKPKP